MAQAEINVITIFRRLAEAIDALTEDEIKRLSDPQYDVEVRAVRRRPKEDTLDATLKVDADEVIRTITGKATRLEAQSFLDSNFSNKKMLEQIARRLDIPIIRQDKVEVLRDKIIEATVGAKMRSQAIQGTGA
jgi:hypothetical protein